jgi:hypothetical protein
VPYVLLGCMNNAGVFYHRMNIKNCQGSSRGNWVRNLTISDQVLTTQAMKSYQLNLTEEQLLIIYQSLQQSQQAADISIASSLLFYLESVLHSTFTTSDSGSTASPGSLPHSVLSRTSAPSSYSSDDDERTISFRSPTKAITPVKTLPLLLESDAAAAATSVGSEILIGDGIGLTGESISELLSDLANTFSSLSGLRDMSAWDLLLQFASSDDISLPQAEEQLKAYLGSAYVDEEWQPAYRIVMEAKNDSGIALEGLTSLMRTIFPTNSFVAPSMPMPISTTTHRLFSSPPTPFTFTVIPPSKMMQIRSMGPNTRSKGTISLDGEFEGGDGGGEPPKVINACPPKRGSRPSRHPRKKAATKWAVSDEHQLHGSGALPDSACRIISRIMDSSVIDAVVLGSISSQFQQYILGKSPVLGSSQALFQVDSLDAITERCLRSEELLFAYDFISMVNYISFTAKVKRYIFLVALE